MSHSKITRREFSIQSILTMLSGVVVTVTGCGGSDSPSSPSAAPPAASPPPAPDGITGEISSNHGHQAFIEDARIQAGEMVSIDISGNAGHPHTVELSADEVQAIGNGEQVSKRSSTLVPDDRLYSDVAQHSHIVTFN